MKVEGPETLRAQFAGMQKTVEDSLTPWEIQSGRLSMKMWLRSSPARFLESGLDQDYVNTESTDLFSHSKRKKASVLLLPPP